MIKKERFNRSFLIQFENRGKGGVFAGGIGILRILPGAQDNLLRLNVPSGLAGLPRAQVSQKG